MVFRSFDGQLWLALHRPNQTPNERPQFIPLKETHLQAKINALSAYKTQEGRHYMAPEFIRSLAKVRGTQINVDYAEAFEVVRLIV